MNAPLETIAAVVVVRLDRAIQHTQVLVINNVDRDYWVTRFRG